MTETIAKTEISFTVNGRPRTVTVEPRKTLADTLREDCGLTGTHVGCEHGVCGACTVLVDGKAVRSCLMFGAQADGAEIRTVEGLAEGEALAPLQEAFIRNHALQCGFCTPGFLMLITGALDENPDIRDEELTEILSSNLCRCTGYRNIIRAAIETAETLRRSRGAA
ncbi:(2Fe-2S)-binding protein [Salipiger pentaromativorans]|uniref:(2Fe-2S)-binding protein n=1 Tax=Salipiger pentaromativorans TaxID=2943193 RepID=UPI00237D2172|nr:(2Fe-2S)-binding protein [Salipiger pentaromativorans]